VGNPASPPLPCVPASLIPNNSSTLPASSHIKNTHETLKIFLNHFHIQTKALRHPSSAKQTFFNVTVSRTLLNPLQLVYQTHSRSQVLARNFFSYVDLCLQFLFSSAALNTTNGSRVIRVFLLVDIEDEEEAKKSERESETSFTMILHHLTLTLSTIHIHR
jgi:hypothetical protein